MLKQQTYLMCPVFYWYKHDLILTFQLLCFWFAYIPFLSVNHSSWSSLCSSITVIISFVISVKYYFIPCCHYFALFFRYGFWSFFFLKSLKYLLIFSLMSYQNFTKWNVETTCHKVVTNAYLLSIFYIIVDVLELL